MAKVRDFGWEPVETAYWSTSATQIEPFAPLTQSVVADTVVIGAGYTGLAAAVSLAEAGQDVVVLEAQQPGWAASGRNAAQVCPMLSGTTTDKIIAMFGEDQGGRISRLIATSGATVFDLIDRLKIDCKPRPNGSIFVARTQKSFDRIIAEAATFGTFGARTEVLQRPKLGKFVKSERYVGGVRYLDGGLIQPLSFARGLARAAAAAGARIFSGSPVVAKERDGSDWIVRTPAGEVRAKTVLFATGAYLEPGLVPPLETVGYPVVAAMLVSRPLPDRGQSFLPAGGPIVDVDDHAVFSPAIDLEGRLTATVLVTGKPKSLADLSPIIDRRLHKAFPQLPPVSWDWHWFGRMMVTPDHLPKIVKVADGVYAGVGCQGLGITYATTTGLELARLANGVPEGDVALPVVSPVKVPMARLMPALMRHLLFPMVNRLSA